MKGVTVTDAPQVNIDEWLDPQSEKYNPTLAHAIFHYSARAAKKERFEVAIATDEMNRAAWMYGHDSQIILDGTFGVCDSRLLLFIVMAVDENRKGVPVAFLLFSAPSGNKQTSSGYDTKILTKLLQKWSESLNKCAHLYGFAGVIFRPLSAITDTDLKERGALIIIFPDIWLLICRFHLRQSWCNHRNKLLKGKSPVMLDLKRRMAALETGLVATQTIEAARELLEAERQVMVKLAAAHKRPARKAMELINYLDTYWTTDNLWKSWSDYGRTVLSSLLNRPAEGVTPTTNHLESFNRVLKRVHLRRWQNGGRRIRVDILIHALSNCGTYQVTPRVLLEQKGLPKAAAMVPKIAYLVADPEHESRGRELLENRQMSSPVMLPGNVGLTLTCYSAGALSIDTNPTIYTIRLGFNGVVSCQCRDFMERGGACKHIRGALIMLDDLRRQGTNVPPVPIPRSLVDAQTLQAAAVLTITIPPSKADLPTSRAAEKLDEVLKEDDTCFEVESDTDGDDDGDNNSSVATDASSDSDSDSESDEDDLPNAETGSEQRREFASQNVAALGEQAISRTIFEFRELESKFADLSEYLDQRVTGLSPEEREEIGRGYGQLANLMTKMDRVLNLPPPSTITPSTPSTAPTGSTSCTPDTSSGVREKRKHLLPPSPEKMQKRHQSYSFH
ncbi:hypothetical protein C8F04DRAFT_1260815 [Mycena alexandri]|uniref:SWIM-type domain-containing protein n=1 Tax=Mycena alexandri TaxID=1745969 RepID=A0AAD6X3J5_9AGAR|nr:hypothetical protein C8F04DRAFT_1260815 [Mycena alexandri]